jgi:diadenosine tetraphosphate (Ap4A) HIT family hydrolase
MYPRKPVGASMVKAYTERTQTGPCFICEMMAHNPAYDLDHIIYEDEIAFVFLNRYPTLLGYTLVAPRRHLEHVTGSFAPDEYLALQRVIYRVGEAVRRSVPTERLYVLSLGSQQGNRHVHWHIAPLPPGVPYQDQQFQALMWEHSGGILDIPPEDMRALAQRIRHEMDGLPDAP